MDKSMAKRGSRENNVNNLFTTIMNAFIITFSLIGIWALSCLIGGLFASAGQVLTPILSI